MSEECAICSRQVDAHGDCEMRHFRATSADRACFICKREAFHFLTFKGRTVCGACSPFSTLGERMLLTDGEAEAIEKGGQDGGEYLDSIGKTDLATLDEGEWSTFLGKVLTGYSAHMQAAVAADPPF